MLNTIIKVPPPTERSIRLHRLLRRTDIGDEGKYASMEKSGEWTVRWLAIPTGGYHPVVDFADAWDDISCGIRNVAENIAICVALHARFGIGQDVLWAMSRHFRFDLDVMDKVHPAASHVYRIRMQGLSYP